MKPGQSQTNLIFQNARSGSAVLPVHAHMPLGADEPQENNENCFVSTVTLSNNLNGNLNC
jgi:hypothetical protein